MHGRLGSVFFFSSRRRHTRLTCDWSSDVCSSDLGRGSTVRSSARGPSMSTRPAVCLRCDWEGDGLVGAPCPSCGVGLYVWPRRAHGGGGATSLRGPVPTQPPLRDVAPPSSSGVDPVRRFGEEPDRAGARPSP